jgi:hypothetical protein
LQSELIAIESKFLQNSAATAGGGALLWDPILSDTVLSSSSFEDFEKHQNNGHHTGDIIGNTQLSLKDSETHSFAIQDLFAAASLSSVLSGPSVSGTSLVFMKDVELLDNTAQYGDNLATNSHSLMHYPVTREALLRSPQSSSLPLSPAVALYLIDEFGSSVVSEHSLIVTARATTWRDGSKFTSGNLIGSTILGVASGNVTFVGMGILAEPGTNATLYFIANTPSGVIYAAPITLNIASCQPGEYMQDKIRCRICPDGQFSSAVNVQVCTPCPFGSETSPDRSQCYCSSDPSAKLSPPCLENIALDGPAQIIVLFLGFSGFVLLLLLMYLIYRFRTNRVIHSASPVYCFIIVSGGLLVILSVIIAALGRTPSACTARVWFLNLGFTMTFGALFVKTYRLHKIFNNAILRSVAITNNQLLRRLGAMVAMDVFWLILWTSVSPYVLESADRPVCVASNDKFPFPVIMVVMKGAMMLYGTKLTWDVRGVPSAFNETTYISITIYNTAASSVLWLILQYGATTLAPRAITLIEAGVALWNVYLGHVVIFAPKLHLIRTGKDGASVKTSIQSSPLNNSKKSFSSNNTTLLSDGDKRYSNDASFDIESAKKDVNEMLEELTTVCHSLQSSLTKKTLKEREVTLALAAATKSESRLAQVHSELVYLLDIVKRHQSHLGDNDRLWLKTINSRRERILVEHGGSSDSGSGEIHSSDSGKRQMSVMQDQL